MSKFDKEKEYDKEIASIVEELRNKCLKHDIPCLVSLKIADDGEDVTVVNGFTVSTEQQPTNEQKLAYRILKGGMKVLRLFASKCEDHFAADVSEIFGTSTKIEA
jgi:hypothetical protein